MTRRKFAGALVFFAMGLLWLGLSSGSAHAAQTVHLILEVDGVLIEGESTITSLDRENTIECFSFGESVYTPVDAATGLASGKRQHRPITVTKTVDKSSPLLWKAWSENAPVTRAEFMFFRPAAGGGGQEEKFLTILLEGGAIVAMSTGSEDPTVGGAGAPPTLESVTFTYQQITWTYEIGGVTHTDVWGTPGPGP